MAGFAHILAVAADAHAVFQVEADNAEFGGQLYFVALQAGGGEDLADEFFVGAGGTGGVGAGFAVDVGGVDEGDAGVECGVDGLFRYFVRG